MNHKIRAPQVRVIDDKGEMLGVFPVEEAIRIAEDRGMDLIEVAPEAKPPTCRIMDYGKFLYEQKKKAQEAKKNQTVIVIKEIQLRPRTDQHDLDVKLRKARDFIEDNAKVKVNLRFRGREMIHQDQGLKVIESFIDALKDIAIVEVPPKTEGRQLFTMLAADPAYLKDRARALKAAAKQSSGEAKKAAANPSSESESTNPS